LDNKKVVMIMRAKKIRFMTLFLALAVLLILSSVVSYAYNEVAAYGEPNIRMCSCSPVDTKFVVRNNEAFTRSYELLIDKKYSEMIGITPYSFVLGPGQSIELKESINPSCNIKDADYEVNFRLVSNIGLVKSITQKIKVQNCDNIVVSPIDNDETICACGTANFIVQVNNSGYYNEDYSAYLDTFSDRSSINRNPSLISSGNSDILVLRVNPECSVTGDYKLNLNVKAKNSGLVESVPLYLRIKDCYDYLLSAQGKTICESEEAIIPININNKGPLADSYKLWLDKDYNNAYLNEHEIKIDPTSDASTNMVIKAPFKSGSTFTPTLYTKSELGNEIKSTKVPIKIENCYFPEIGKSSKVIEIKYSRLDTLIPVKNTGKKNANYKLSVDSNQNWVNIKGSTLALKPSETGYIELITSPSEDINPGKHSFTLSLQADDGVSYAQDFTLILTKESESGYLGLLNQYWPYLLGVLVVLILIILLAYFSLRKSDKPKKEKALEEPSKKTKQLEIKKEKKEKPKRKEKEIEVPIWPFVLILLIALVAAGSYYAYNNWYAKPLTSTTTTVETAITLGTTTFETTTTLEEITTTTSTTIAKTITTTSSTTTTLKSGYPDVGSIIYKYFGIYKWYILIGLIVLILIVIALIAIRKLHSGKRGSKEIKKEEKKSSSKRVKDEIFTNVPEDGIKEASKRRKEDEEPSDWPLYVFLLVILGLIIGALYYLHIKFGLINISLWIYGSIKFFVNIVMTNIWYILIGIVVVIILFVLRSFFKRVRKRNELEALLSSYSVNDDVTIPINERIGIGELSFRIRKKIAGGKIYLRRLRRQPTFLRAGKFVYKYFEIREEDIDEEALSNILLRFRIKKYWIEDYNINLKTIKVKRYEKRNWEELPTRIIDEDDYYFYFETRLPQFSYYAITAEPKEVKEKEKHEQPVEEKPVIAKQEKKAEKGIDKKFKEEQKLEKEKKKDDEKEEGMSRWPTYVLLLVVIVILASLIYYNYGSIQNAIDNMNKGSTTTLTTITTTTLSSLSTDDVLSAIGDGRYKYNSDGKVVNTESNKVLNDTELADLLLANMYDILSKTNISVEELNQKINSLDEKKEIKENKGIPLQMWTGNTDHILDLSDYFYDPDEDALTYTASQTEHIDVEINKSIVSFIPERNWYGYEPIFFTADDGKGGTLQSNEVMLVVKKSPPLPAQEQIKEEIGGSVSGVNNGLKSAYNYISDYFSYIIAGIVILLIVILFVRYSDKMVEVEEAEEKKEDRKELDKSKSKKKNSK